MMPRTLPPCDHDECPPSRCRRPAPTFEPEDYPEGTRVCVLIQVWDYQWMFWQGISGNPAKESPDTLLVVNCDDGRIWLIYFDRCYRPRRHD